MLWYQKPSQEVGFLDYFELKSLKYLIFFLNFKEKPQEKTFVFLVFFSNFLSYPKE